jgi:hypothetical protein
MSFRSETPDGFNERAIQSRQHVALMSTRAILCDGVLNKIGRFHRRGRRSASRADNFSHPLPCKLSCIILPELDFDY